MWVWIIGFIVVVVIVGSISSAAKTTEEAQKKVEFNEIAKTRVDAYVDYIRRTSSRSDFNRMSDLELKDMIGQQIRSFKSSVSGAQGISSFVFFGGLVLATILGVSEKSWITFIVFGVIAFVAGGGLVAFLTKKIEDDFRAKGFDPERLKIEE